MFAAVACDRLRLCVDGLRQEDPALASLRDAYDQLCRKDAADACSSSYAANHKTDAEFAPCERASTFFCDSQIPPNRGFHMLHENPECPTANIDGTDIVGFAEDAETALRSTAGYRLKNWQIPIFLAWAKDNLTFADVAVSQNETSPGLIHKNNFGEFGKRICLPGRVVQIHSDSLSNAGPHSGVFVSRSAETIYFHAVRSTGDLVEGSRARICGYVMGTKSYNNVSGGTTHSVELVGLFDLPENRRPTLQQPN